MFDNEDNHDRDNLFERDSGKSSDLSGSGEEHV